MTDRDRVGMDPAGVAAFLAQARKVQLATLNRDGTPHLVTMFYAVRDGRLVFWTYRTSQKAHNLARDPRVTCLVEAGDRYFELRGVQITGTAVRVDDPAGVAGIGRLVAARLPDVPEKGLERYVTRAARKRVGYVVQPHRVVSWDHRRLLT